MFFLIFPPDLFYLNVKSEFFKTVSQMLNTVVKRLFAFNCAIYSLPYIFYPKFTQSLPNILPSFLFDLCIRKRNLKSWFKYPWKDFDKEKLKRGPGKEQWTVLLTKNKNRNANMISQYTNIIFFSFQEHFHVPTFYGMTKKSVKNDLKGSCPALKFQDCIWR